MNPRQVVKSSGKLETVVSAWPAYVTIGVNRCGLSDATSAGASSWSRQARDKDYGTSSQRTKERAVNISGPQ